MGKETPDPKLPKGFLKAVRGTVTTLGQTGNLSSQNKDQIHHVGSLSTSPLFFPKGLNWPPGYKCPSDSPRP